MSKTFEFAQMPNSKGNQSKHTPKHSGGVTSGRGQKVDVDKYSCSDKPYKNDAYMSKSVKNWER